MNYVKNFGVQWNRHTQTQLDSYTGFPLSERRFFSQSQWSRNLTGQKVLEVGCGAGRFTEIIGRTGASVISIDYSQAVFANGITNGWKGNVDIVQADLYDLPFQHNCFDKIFCFGVLQHLPDVRRGVLSLPKYLKTGGELVVDVYRYNLWRRLFPRHIVRLITCRLEHESLYSACRWYVTVMWRLTRWACKLPHWPGIAKNLLCFSDYTGKYPLSGHLLKEWAILDTFDNLSARYEKPQTAETLKGWLLEAGLSNVEVFRSNGPLVGKGTKVLY
jgi:SAM-dependent methyltransferase